MENLIVKDLDFKKLEREYLSYIDVTPKTVETYNIALRQFYTYMNDNGIKQPTRQDVIEFRESLKADHKVSTINSYLIALRNFFKFLSYNNVYKDITENVKGLKDTELHKREFLDSNDCRRLIESAVNLREKALVSLTMTCGLRANEIVNIQINDFKEENGNIVLYILGKGRDSKQDYVVVPDSVLSIIREYITQYDINNYLFVSTSRNNTGGKLSTASVRNIINSMYERIGIKKDTITLHSLRHSMATLSIEAGADIREVSQALRHKSVRTTEIYLHDLEMKNNKCSNLIANAILGGN